MSFRNPHRLCDWAWYVTKTEKEHLKNIEIYGAVVAMLKYVPSNNIFKGFTKHWNHLTNICFIEDCEITLILLEAYGWACQFLENFMKNLS